MLKSFNGCLARNLDRRLQVSIDFSIVSLMIKLKRFVIALGYTIETGEFLEKRSLSFLLSLYDCL